MSHTVYTYYTPIECRGIDTQVQMLQHWSSSWAKRGWETVVLGLEDAKAHPFFDEYAEAVQRLPTINPKDYEMACYHRWLAVAHRGGGFMADYDVANYGFEARSPQARLTIYEQNYETEAVTPSVVGGSAAGFYDMCLYFATCNIDDVMGEFDGKPHTSDMIVLQKIYHRLAYQAIPLCKQYGSPGWEDAPLVHFSHETTKETDRIPCMKTSRPI